MGIKLKMRKLSAIFTLLILFTTCKTEAAGQRYYLKFEHFICPLVYAQSLERIIDAGSKSEWTESISNAIYTGTCTGVVKAQVSVSGLVYRTSPKGKKYACFRYEDGTGEATSEFQCAASTFITSVEQEFANRKGDYSLVNENSRVIKITCLEGGSVILLKDSNDLIRISLVFPFLINEPSVKTSGSREQIIRDGCKGVDYKEQINSETAQPFN